jgi:hypothetical protein
VRATAISQGGQKRRKLGEKEERKTGPFSISSLPRLFFFSLLFLLFVLALMKI